MDRDEDIRESMQPFIDRLFELYEETDPSKGEASESDKLEQAHQAIHIWWRIYGRLLLWAQAQIVGYEIARDSPKLVDELSKFRGSQINDDSHELELLGLGWSWNPPVNQIDRKHELDEARGGVSHRSSPTTPAGPAPSSELGRVLINRQPNADLDVPSNVRYWGQSGRP